MPSASHTGVLRAVAGDVVRAVGGLLGGGVAIVALSLWHRVAGLREPISDSGRNREVDPAVVEHELDWYRYVKAFDAHHGPGGGPERAVASGSFLRGLRVWMATRCLRGYTLGDEVYVCPNAPRVLRVHQAGHAPAFGRECSTLARPRREDGGIDDEPLATLDVMLSGDFPHTLLRVRDPRGLTERYERWVREGRIERVRGP